MQYGMHFQICNYIIDCTIQNVLKKKYILDHAM